MDVETEFYGHENPLKHHHHNSDTIFVNAVFAGVKWRSPSDLDPMVWCCVALHSSFQKHDKMRCVSMTCLRKSWARTDVEIEFYDHENPQKNHQYTLIRRYSKMYFFAGRKWRSPSDLDLFLDFGCWSRHPGGAVFCFEFLHKKRYNRCNNTF